MRNDAPFLKERGTDEVGGQLIPLCLNKGKQKDITYFPLWRERGNDDKGLSSLAVSPQNYEIFDFHTIDSPVFADGLADGGKQNVVCWDTGKRAVVHLTLIQL